MTAIDVLRAIERALQDHTAAEVLDENSPLRDAMRSALAEPAVAVQAEPVAMIGRDFQLLWTSGDAISDIVKRHGLKVGSCLYTTKPAAPATADEVSDVNVALEAVDVLYALTLQQSTPAQRIDAKIALKRAILALRSGASAQPAPSLREVLDNFETTARNLNRLIIDGKDKEQPHDR